jgi:hypothetical protein
MHSHISERVTTQPSQPVDLLIWPCQVPLLVNPYVFTNRQPIFGNTETPGRDSGDMLYQSTSELDPETSRFYLKRIYLRMR